MYINEVVFFECKVSENVPQMVKNILFLYNVYWQSVAVGNYMVKINVE